MTSPATPRNFGRSAPRLAAFYAASFLVVGVQLPFWPVWLTGRGFDINQIATLFAAGIWAKVIATPMIGALADRSGATRGTIIGLAVIAVAAYAALWPAAGYWPILALCLVAGVALSAMMPLADSLTLARVRDEGADYGRIRLWGSVSFVAAALGSGAVLGIRTADGADNTVVVLVTLACGTLLAASLALPRQVRRPRAASRWAAVGRLAADRRFWLFVVSASAVQSSHQLYYGFGTLYWRGVGFSDAVIGGLWSEGVVAEIVLFWYGAALLRRLGPIGLMALGGLAGIVRWSLVGIVPGVPAAALLQLLHAGTFAASQLGAMHFMARTVPPEAAASAQTLYAAASAGIGSGMVMLAAGALYAAYGGQAYLFMAVLSGIGLAGTGLLARTGRRL